MSAAGGAAPRSEDTVRKSLPVTAAAPGPTNEGGDLGHADRFERIRQLQLQAIYPLDPVAAVRAQSQLAHVEVPWLTRQLQQTLTRIEGLTAQEGIQPTDAAQ